MRAGAFVGLPDVLARFGLSAEPILRDLELPPGLFGDASSTLRVEDAGRLLALCAERTGCFHFGLLAGEKTAATSLGLPGLLLLGAPDLGAALRALVLTLHFSGRAVVPTVTEQHGATAFGVTLATHIPAGRPQGQDLSMTIALNLVRAVLGPDWIPDAVMLAHSAPPDRRPYRQVFGVDVAFDAEISALVFPSALMSCRTTPVSPEAPGHIERLLATKAATDEEFVLFCRRAIVALIVQRRESVDEVARVMGLHRRTLNRRLAMHGTTVADLINGVRLGMSRDLLADTQMPVAQVASAVYYADAATLTRLFRRSTGMTPSEWRRNAR